MLLIYDLGGNMYTQSIDDLKNVINIHYEYSREQQEACNYFNSLSSINDVDMNLLKKYRAVFCDGKHNEIIPSINQVAAEWVRKYFNRIAKCQ